MTLKFNNNAPLGFRKGSPLVPVTPFWFLHHCQGERWSSPAELWSPSGVPCLRPHLETLRKPNTPNCCLVHSHKQQSESHVELLSQWVSPHLPGTSYLGQHWKRTVQPLSKSLVLDLMLCTDVSSAIWSWYHSASPALPPAPSPLPEWTFFIPRTSSRCQHVLWSTYQHIGGSDHITGNQ